MGLDIKTKIFEDYITQQVLLEDKSILITVLFVIVRKIGTTQMFINCRRDKLHDSHTMKHHTLVKISKLQIYVKTWMNLKNIMLNLKSK